MKSFTLISLTFFCLFSSHLSAQEKQKLPYNEINISEGLLSHYQILGIGEGPARKYMNMPSIMTGALFITYKTYLNNRSALSISVGLDNQNGDLSYGNPRMSTYTPGTSGNYKRRSYTAAFGYTMIYKKAGRISTYGHLGIGATYAFERYTVNDDAKYRSIFYGTNGIVPANPYKEMHHHLTGQITPLGIRVQGHFAGFIEIGYGYRGIISGGIAINLSRSYYAKDRSQSKTP